MKALAAFNWIATHTLELALLVLALLAFGAVAGCSVTGTALEGLAPAARVVTDQVCGASTVERELIREKADEATAPHRVRVECGEP